MGTQRKIASGIKWVEAMHPIRPAMEFTRIKAALIPEVVRVLAQPEKSMMGERNIPQHHQAHSIYPQYFCG